jgi:hypothetical protein
MGNFADDEEFRDDTDSLYRMPMALLPLETVELKRGCMIKNVSLKSADEGLLKN